MAQPDPATLQVVARAPFQLYYQGPAKVVTAVNKVGPFDILPGHADFFSMLSPGDIIIETEGEPVVFSVHTGIIAVRNDKVDLFVNM